MASHDFQIAKEKWLEEVRALAKEKDIYMRFWFLHGHILAKPSKILVGDRTHLLLQPLSEPSGSDPIELLIVLPDENMVLYEKRTNETCGVCLSITYKLEIHGFLQPAEKLHLSNQESFLDPEDSESLLQ